MRECNRGEDVKYGCWEGNRVLITKIEMMIKAIYKEGFGRINSPR